MEFLVLFVFSALLVGCVITGIPVVYALSAGFFIFLGYGVAKKHPVSVLLSKAFHSVLKVRTVLTFYIFIGLITSLWRASGTIPAIILRAEPFLSPIFFIPAVFVLNALLSTLVGSSFAAAASMGTVCVIVSNILGFSPVLCGGAMLAGVYVGDRCSPVSSCAMLVAELTGTEIYSNIKAMIKSSAVPLTVSVIIFAAAGVMNMSSASPNPFGEINRIFSANFNISFPTLLPALSIIVLAFFRAGAKKNMAVSSALAFLVCVFVQKTAPSELLRFVMFGFQSHDAELARILNGGGLPSVVGVAEIVVISSTYSGLFEETKLTDALQDVIRSLGEKTTSYCAVLAASIIISAVACSQTFAVMLTHQLCGKAEPDRQKMMLDLADSAAIIPPLIPWSVAGYVPLAMAGAPTAGICCAFYLMILPVWRLVLSFREKRRNAAAV